MKKFISCFALCFCMLVSGIIFSACDFGGDRKISFEMDTSLLEMKVIADREEVTSNESGVYTVSDEANVRLEIYAKESAVDISSIVIKENSKERTLQKNDSYAPLEEKGSLYCGYFLIPCIDENVEITIDGVEKYRSTFSFSAVNLEDEQVQERLKSTKIGFDETLLPLEDILSTNKTYVRNYDVSMGNDNTHHVLRMQFENSEIYDFQEKSPLRVLFDDGRELAAENFTKQEDFIYVNLGDIGYQKHYTIVADFTDLAYKQFSFSYFEEVFAYTIETSSETIDVSKEGFLYLSKNLEAINYELVEVKLDSIKLEKVDVDDEKITFKIPNNIVPENGTDFHVLVSGLEYTQNTFKVTTQILNENESNALLHLTYGAFVVDENGKNLGVVNYDQDGNQIAIENMMVAFAWQFVNYEKEDEIVAFNGDIYVNDIKICNLKELLSEATSGLEQLEDLVYEIDDETILRARFNQEQGCFDSFQLETLCKADINFCLSI